ncbi:HNH endonuclease [Burkholderia multivorans]|uniref:HNH endonuclease n=1 Tax=Burkholderia multivorans TaxID=87883 RepID=UPI001FC82220|nr:HNH endonuclease [Burkholderia multivorans]
MRLAINRPRSSGQTASLFFEVHHLRRLADDGSDTPTNAVAVCPNCHRRLHFSENARAYRETLY